jgi:phosphatidate cytidylyltransferase
LFYKLLIIAFINDSFAYIVGSNIRGPLIAPKISPNKTWSGTLSSFILTIILLLLININIYFSLILSMSLFFGDLFFSFIKRKLYIKDFSNLLKSHGGILDRFDSFFLFITIYNLIFVSSSLL